MIIFIDPESGGTEISDRNLSGTAGESHSSQSNDFGMGALLLFRPSREGGM